MIKSFRFIVIMVALSNMASANVLFDPITLWPFAKNANAPKSCIAKIEREIQMQRDAKRYPKMGTEKIGMYRHIGVSYYKELTAHRILLRGVVYKGPETVFSSDILVPQGPCNHYFEYWKGEVESPESTCRIKKLEHKIDNKGYHAC